MSICREIDEEDLAQVLVGRKVVNIKEVYGSTELTLDDGTIVALSDTADCCAWYSQEVKNINLLDNIITKAEVKELPEDSEAEDGWIITILSHDKEIGSINVEGDPTSGYYVHSIIIEVEK